MSKNPLNTKASILKSMVYWRDESARESKANALLRRRVRALRKVLLNHACGEYGDDITPALRADSALARRRSK